MRTHSKFIVACIATILSMLISSVAFASQVGVYTEIKDRTDATFTHTSSMPSSDTGRSDGAHLYYLYTGGKAQMWGKWSCSGPTTALKDYKWWVWIPLNGGYYDAGVNYTVRNSNETFTIPLNQENHANEWVLLGWAYGNGTTTQCNTTMYNNCVGGFSCDTQHDVWWDDGRYYVCNSAGC